jgi:hypothetical protein
MSSDVTQPNSQAFVESVVITHPGWGYVSPPDVFILAEGAATAGGTAVMSTNPRDTAQQFGFELSNVNGQFLRYDADASTSSRQIIMMDGLIPASSTGISGSASSNITVTLSQYVTARLKAYKSPIQLNTSRNDVANNKVMGTALAELAKYCPNLYANDLSVQLATAIFYSLGGPETALNAASTGHGAGLWDIGKRMFHVARQAYKSVERAIDSLDPSTKAALSNLARGPEAMRALGKVKSMVGLSSVPDATIMRGAELANRQLSRIFASSDAIGAGFFDSMGRAINIASGGVNAARDLGLLAGSDAGLHGGSDAKLGAGFWDTVGTAASIALPLLLDDGTYASRQGTSSRQEKGRYYAADSSFPVLNTDGTSAGQLSLSISHAPKRMRLYVTQPSVGGDVHIDSRLESVKSGESQPAFEACKAWLRKHPQYSDIYVTVEKNLTRPLFGRSWEAALANALAGRNNLITGKITHVASDGVKDVAHIGPIVGVSEKKRMGTHLIVPRSNAHEAPGNKAVSAISLN